MKTIARITLAALAALLVGCGSEPFAVYPLDDGAVCALFGSTGGIRRIELTAPDGEVQIIRPESPDIEPSAAGGAEWIDLDFDGDLDLTLEVKRYASGAVRRACYRYEDGRLVEEETLSALRDLTVDPDAQQLVAWSRRLVEEESDTLSRTTYVWHNGAPTPIARRSLIHYIAEDEEVWCVVDYTADPGAPLTEADERWIFPDRFNADVEAEIWNSPNPTKETP